ncbi:MAG: hypothetical protein HC813_00815 [Planctomycetes bacterium]|nr:hypothetical protein [Planctomycetota bacterium]
MSERDVLELDCLIVGAGPAGLAAALRFQQIATEAGAGDLTIASSRRGAPPASTPSAAPSWIRAPG